MDLSVINIVILFIVLGILYLFVYGWTFGYWHPIRRIHLWFMKVRKRHCNNCRYLGYNDECYCYRPKIKRKYDYKTGTYYKAPSGAGVKTIDEVIGTLHCKWKPSSKK